MNLRQLRYFIVAAEEEHLTRAATRLGIQQPPLSQQISALERDLGVALFVRRSRSVQLNAAGRLFLNDARKILADIDAAVARVRQFDTALEGNLRVGFTSSASLHGTTLDIVRAFRASYPLVALRVTEGANHDLLELAEKGELDVAFVRSSVERYPSLEHFRLLDEPMVLAIPAPNSLADEPDEPVAFDVLRNEPVVLYRQINGSGIGAMLIEAAHAAGFEFAIVEEASRMISALQLVAAGFAVAVVPATMRFFANPMIVYRDFIPSSAPTVPLNVAYRGAGASDTANRFVSICRASVIGGSS
jgi:DNA-binding transcriptional LysR family regulator